jgi:hypothetical protein
MIRLILCLIVSSAYAATYFDVGLLVHKRKVNSVTDIHSFIQVSENGAIDQYELAAMVKQLSRRLAKQEPLWVQWHPVFNYLMIDTRPDPIVEEDGINIEQIRPMLAAHRLSPTTRLQIDHMLKSMRQRSVLKIIRAFDCIAAP